MFYRYFFTVWLCCLLIPNCFAQQDQNLVPNGHFEDYYMCPDDISQIERLAEWNSWRITPDYFNICDSSNLVGVPGNDSFGFQVSRSGSGYIGLAGLTQNGDREIIGVELNEALNIGEEYYIEFYWSRAFGGGFHHQCDCASNRLGVLFTNHEYDFANDEMPVTNYAHLYESELMIDSVNWVKISGWVEADSNYQYLALGNFFDADSCEVEYLNTDPDEEPFKSYYYIEDVCVATDPVFCDLGNNIAKENEDKLMVHRSGPNSLVVHGVDSLVDWEIYDSSGRIISHGKIISGEHINISSLSHGIYVIAINTRDGVRTERFLKNSQ